MIASHLPAPAPWTATVPFLSELLERQRILARYGFLLLALAVPVLLLIAIDARTLESGVSIWVKPAKFLISLAIFALTAGWFFGYIRPERRNAKPMRTAVWLILIGGTFEIVYISWQASQSLESHFNLSTPFYAIMYTLMGIFSVALTASTLPMAWEIARRPAPGISRDFAAAVAIGLLLTFILGAGYGAYMGSRTGHSVGAVGGQVPLFGWNRSGGDLRIAHFLGIHAEQAIPLLGLLIAGFAERVRWLLLGLGTAAYVALSAGIFILAVNGKPLLPL